MLPSGMDTTAASARQSLTSSRDRAERRVAKNGQVKINHYAWAYKMATEIDGVKTYASSSFSTYH